MDHITCVFVGDGAQEKDVAIEHQKKNLSKSIKEWLH